MNFFLIPVFESHFHAPIKPKPFPTLSLRNLTLKKKKKKKKKLLSRATSQNRRKKSHFCSATDNLAGQCILSGEKYFTVFLRPSRILGNECRYDVTKIYLVPSPYLSWAFYPKNIKRKGNQFSIVRKIVDFSPHGERGESEEERGKREKRGYAKRKLNIPFIFLLFSLF